MPPHGTLPGQTDREGEWRNLLLQEGLPAMIRSSDAVSFLGISLLPCRLVVPENHKEEALAILELHLGNEL